METPSVRILVIGDSGVGKTTLLRSICRAQSLFSSRNDKPSALWTTGCDVHVLLKSFESSGREMFVEFLDVGGHRQYERSRGAFYYDVHGVLFVHDLSNAKSGEHLRHWSRELSTIQRLKGCVVPSIGKDRDFPTLNDLPKLVVGTKKDVVFQNYRQKMTRPIEFAEFRTLPCIATSAEPLSIEPSGVFDTFLQQALTFANRDNDGLSYRNYHNNTVGLRPTFSRGIDGDETRLGLNVGYKNHTTALPPLSTGSGSARSRWL